MKYLKKFNTVTEYEVAESSLILPNVSLVTENNTVHYNPYVDPCASEKVKTTYELVDLGLPSGTKWANKNIGALTETDCGQYFAWGDIQGFTADQVSGTCHSKAFLWADYKYGNGKSSQSTRDMTKYNSDDGKTVLEASDDAAVANMGGSWRMPTNTDFYELLDTSNCTNAWTTNYNGTGINGNLFTSKSNGNTLFFPAAGFCSNDGVRQVGKNGRYWSSSITASNVINSGGLYFYNGNRYVDGNSRYIGQAVRGVVG